MSRSEGPQPLGPSAVTAFIRKTIKDALWQVHYYERELIKAHEDLALAKAFILRSGADLGFTLDELRAEIEKEEEGDDE